jgi:hypothetical protein
VHSQTHCNECQAPQWQDSPGATSCKNSPSHPDLCPAGAWGQVAATMPDTPCHACPTGKYQGNPGQSTCWECNSGRYTDLKGQSSCKSGTGLCAAGSHGLVGATSQAAATCHFCPPDTFQQHPGQPDCRSCPVGQHQPSTGQSSCLDIPKCDRYYTWNPSERKCEIRHPYIRMLVAMAWTAWVWNLVAIYCGLSDPQGPTSLGPAYIFLVALGIGIEVTRTPSGYVDTPSFWVMLVWLVSCHAIHLYDVGKCAYKWCGPCCPRPHPKDDRQHTGGGDKVTVGKTADISSVV